MASRRDARGRGRRRKVRDEHDGRNRSAMFRYWVDSVRYGRPLSRLVNRRTYACKYTCTVRKRPLLCSPAPFACPFDSRVVTIDDLCVLEHRAHGQRQVKRRSEERIARRRKAAGVVGVDSMKNYASIISRVKGNFWWPGKGMAYSADPAVGVTIGNVAFLRS